MRIIPVIDLKDGQAVHAVAGRRAEYRPLRSPLADRPCPIAIAREFRDRFGLRELYLADLDAIAGAPRSRAIYQKLAAMGLRLIIDAGVRDPAAARSVQQAGAAEVVAALETLGGPGELAQIVRALGTATLWFSLDLRRGEPLGNTSAWPAGGPQAIADEVVRRGVTRLIVLDLARVGTGTGTGTETLCGELVRRHPQLQLVTGGGVRGPDDVRRLEQLGVHGVLAATALHDGRIRPAPHQA